MLVTGKFDQSIKDVLCAQVLSVSLICYAINANNNSVQISTQVDFIGNDETIVADYDGDMRQDVSLLLIMRIPQQRWMLGVCEYVVYSCIF